MNEFSQSSNNNIQEAGEVENPAEDISESTQIQPPSLYQSLGKRVLDFVLALALLILFAPFMLLIVLLIYKSSIGKPAIYRQSRVGLNGQPFTMLKFRSMKNDRREEYMSNGKYGETDRRLTHKTDKDPRHTRLGKFLRKTSLDELPQLLNVIRGDMSLVGPRPEIVEVAEHYGLINHPRHTVRPGITGLWQVSEHRSELLHENVHIDLDYVTKVTLVGDLIILVRTATSILSRTGK